MTRPCRELPIAHVTQYAAERGIAHRDAVLRMKPTDQITQSPTDNTIQIRNRAVLNDAGQRRPMCCVQTRRSARRLPVNQPVRPFGIETQNPVAECSAHQHSHGGRLRDEGYRHRSRQELKVAGFVCCRMNDMKADEDRPRCSLFEGGYRVSWKTPLFSTLNHVQLNRSIIS